MENTLAEFLAFVTGTPVCNNDRPRALECPGQTQDIDDLFEALEFIASDPFNFAPSAIQDRPDNQVDPDDSFGRLRNVIQQEFLSIADSFKGRSRRELLLELHQRTKNSPELLGFPASLLDCAQEFALLLLNCELTNAKRRAGVEHLPKRSHEETLVEAIGFDDTVTRHGDSPLDVIRLEHNLNILAEEDRTTWMFYVLHDIAALTAAEIAAFYCIDAVDVGSQIQMARNFVRVA